MLNMRQMLCLSFFTYFSNHASHRSIVQAPYLVKNFSFYVCQHVMKFFRTERFAPGTPTQLNLKAISTKLRLNLMWTSLNPQLQTNLNLNLNVNSTSTLTSTLTSTQYGCDVKATQSCY